MRDILKVFFYLFRKRKNDIIPDKVDDNPTAIFPQFSFVPQKGNRFTLETAEWLTAVCNNAFNLHTGRAKEYLKGINSVTELFWHNELFITDQDTMCGYMGKIEGVDGALVIVIRGTDSLAEWYADGLFEQREMNFTGTKIVGRIEKGFSDLYTQPAVTRGKVKVGSLREQILGAIKNRYKETQVVYITGHSLGAGIATLLAADLSVAYPKLSLITYTFASPRVGDPDFTHTFQKYIDSRKAFFTLYRVYNISDVVPTLPFPAMDGTVYEHTQSNVLEDSLEPGKNYMGGIGIESNQGTTVKNHVLCTYIAAMNNYQDTCH